MSRLVPGVAAISLALGMLAAPAVAAEPDGQRLYNLNCALCHGRTGKAAPAFAKKGVPDLADPDWQKERSDADIKKIIETGSPGTLMKPFKEILKPEQIAAVIGYIRRLAAPAPK